MESIFIAHQPTFLIHQASAIEDCFFGLECPTNELYGFCGENFQMVTTVETRQYVLTISNPAEKNPAYKMIYTSFTKIP